jgi:single-strand DNA-binding protein
MSNLRNSVRLNGFLGAAPDVKTTGTGKQVARISLAIHEMRKNEHGERVKETQWHQLVLWEKQAEIAEKYLSKGSEVSIEGRLVNRSYTDKDGIRRYMTEVVVSEIMLPGKNGEALLSTNKKTIDFTKKQND